MFATRCLRWLLGLCSVTVLLGSGEAGTVGPAPLKIDLSLAADAARVDPTLVPPKPEHPALL